MSSLKTNMVNHPDQVFTAARLYILCAACGVGKTTVKDLLADMMPDVMCMDVDQVGLNWWDYAGTPREEDYTADALRLAWTRAGE